MTSSSYPEEDETRLPCPSWVFSNFSNVHVARDRSWFTDEYTPFETFFEDDSFVTTQVKVIGVGSVNLPVKSFPYDDGPEAHGVLRLENVLHAPSAICNMIGDVHTKNFAVSDLSFRSDDGLCGSIYDESARHPVAWLVKRRFLEVLLSEPPLGPKVGPSPFDPDVAYVLRAIWPLEEQRKFETVKSFREQKIKYCPPLTSAEKAWLKTIWENEFKFLLDFGLRINKEEDREEGRRILRKLMEED
ncbi:hypothetical protein PMG11_00505 [Penicillium brasilianum]|uniref:Uncharacterized protein n=1 Tax=Penicillium brasilianum TaxID=104259 RepID=A0A0F7TC25_PENBI|nr:hypothetical protein PMG11_00505 [Penicillium brasilianum]